MSLRSVKERLRLLGRSSSKNRQAEEDGNTKASGETTSSRLVTPSDVGNQRRVGVVTTRNGVTNEHEKHVNSRAGNSAVPDKSPAVASLWERAYVALEIQDPQLLEDYNSLLSGELGGTTSDGDQPDRNPPGQDDNQLQKIGSGIKLVNNADRRDQLDRIIQLGLRRVDEKKTTYTIAGHQFVLSDQVADVAKVVSWGKDLIDQAIRASPEASMVWAGVCLILPLLTISSTAEEANRNGFVYVTGRMRFYVALETLLLRKREDQISVVHGSLKKEFEANIVLLYQHILEFQFKSVLRFYRSRLGNFGRDLRHSEDWEAMLAKVQELEKNLHVDFVKISDSIVRQELEEISKTSLIFAQTSKQLFSVAERHLEVAEEHRDIASKQLQFAEQHVQLLEQAVKLTQKANDAEYIIDLPTVNSALHDSFDDQHIPLCQKGTRNGVLSKIQAWALNDKSETMMWIHGPAGTGKSTISRTVARQFADSGLLAASYFFRRGEEGRNGTTRLFPTLAHRLTVTVPGFKKCLKGCMDESGKVDIDKKALEEQFKILILTPLSQIVLDGAAPSQGDSATVIIIDALDECERYEDIPLVCNLVSKLHTISAVRLRVLLTSRYASPIADTFHDLNDGGTRCRSLSLQEEFFQDTIADITTFLEQKFAEVKKRRPISKNPWPEQGDLDRIVAFATTPSPLFIYAATLCRFVDDGSGRKNPVKQLKLWLQQSEKNASQLSQVYLPILHQLLFGNDGDDEPLSEEDRTILLQFITSIIFLATPLPSQALASVLDIDEDDINCWLRNLHAVLDIPSEPSAPVRLLHKSFSDFILEQETADLAGIRVDTASTHLSLATKCIQRMENANGLQEDICNFGETSKLLEEIDGATIAHHIPPDLEYACLYWVHHLQQSSGGLSDKIDSSQILRFLQIHFLHWLEALALLRKISHGFAMVTSLQLLVTPGENMELSSLLRDAMRFIPKHTSTIEVAPLQLYSSALLFSPETSLIRRQFLDQTKVSIKILYPAALWGPALQTLEAQSTSIALSPDGRILAAASEDKICLWDSATGEVLKILSNKDYVRSVVFSPDGRTLVSVSDGGVIWLHDHTSGALVQALEDGPYCTFLQTRKEWESLVPLTVGFSSQGHLLAVREYDGKVQLWDPTYGTVLQVLESPRKLRIRTVVFSPDGSTIAIAEGKTIQLWRPATGPALRPLNGHRDSVYAVAFSSDGQMLASGSFDWNVLLWDLRTGVRIGTLCPDSDSIFSVAFSRDGKLLAAAMGSGKISIHDIWNGRELMTLEGHVEEVYRVIFSPDNNFLVSGSRETIRIWDVKPQGQTFSHHGISNRSRITAGIFSPNGSIFASGSENGTIQLWNPATRSPLGTLEGHTRAIEGLAFSPDGLMLASATWGDPVRLWNMQSGEVYRNLHHYCRAVAFSPDGQILASVASAGQFTYSIGIRFEAIVLLDPTTGSELRTFDSTLAPVSVKEILFSLDGQSIVARSHGGRENSWDLTTGKIHRTRHESCDRLVLQVAFSPNGQLLASSSTNYLIQVWDCQTMTLKRTLTGHSAPVVTIMFSPNSRLLASGSNDKTVKVWDLTEGTVLHTFSQHSAWLYQVLFAPNGDLLASRSCDGAIHLWDVLAGNALNDPKQAKLSILEEQSFATKAEMAFISNGQLTASWLSNGSVYLWDPMTGTIRRTWKCDRLTKRPETVVGAFSPSGRVFAYGSERSVQLWNTETGAALQTLQSSYVEALVFSPDGRQLVGVSYATTIQLWDVVSGKLLHTLTEEPIDIADSDGVSTIPLLVFSPDCQRLAWGSPDGDVRLWNLETETAAKLLPGHSHTVATLSFSPDGRVLASGSFDGTVRLWDVGAGTCLHTLDNDSRPIRPVTESLDGGLAAAAAAAAVEPHSTSPSLNVEPRCDHLVQRKEIWLDQRSHWVTRGGAKYLFLPVDYRPSTFAVKENVLALSLRSGRVDFLHFTDAKGG